MQHEHSQNALLCATLYAQACVPLHGHVCAHLYVLPGVLQFVHGQPCVNPYVLVCDLVCVRPSDHGARPCASPYGDPCVPHYGLPRVLRFYVLICVHQFDVLPSLFRYVMFYGYRRVNFYVVNGSVVLCVLLCLRGVPYALCFILSHEQDAAHRDAIPAATLDVMALFKDSPMGAANGVLT